VDFSVDFAREDFSADFACEGFSAASACEDFAAAFACEDLPCEDLPCLSVACSSDVRAEPFFVCAPFVVPFVLAVVSDSVSLAAAR
jgi:hypothetical protein